MSLDLLLFWKKNSFYLERKLAREYSESKKNKNKCFRKGKTKKYFRKGNDEDSKGKSGRCQVIRDDFVLQQSRFFRIKPLPDSFWQRGHSDSWNFIENSKKSDFLAGFHLSTFGHFLFADWSHDRGESVELLNEIHFWYFSARKLKFMISFELLSKASQSTHFAQSLIPGFNMSSPPQQFECCQLSAWTWF